MLNRVRAIPRKIVASSRLLADRNAVIFQWATEGIVAWNWGDKLNPYLAEKISGRQVTHRADIYPVPARPVHYWIGSHLATACSDANAIVWGAGFISAAAPIEGHPHEIRAVRGWMSDERLRKKGVRTPGVVGDPALLLPRFFDPQRKLERRSLGIIPHYTERNEPFFVSARNWEDARVIDICGDIEDVVEEVVACDCIVSSSLHGIICADAFGVPAFWLQVSDKPKGDGFKYLDYFSSVGRPDSQPIRVDSRTTRAKVERSFFHYNTHIDLERLWSECPLRSDKS